MQGIQRRRSTKWEVLKRDIQALILEKQGLSYREIAEKLETSEATLKKTMPETTEHLSTLVEFGRIITKEGLREFAESAESSREFRRAQKAAATKTKRVKKGHWLVKPPFAYDLLKGDLVENKKIGKRRKVLRYFLNGMRQVEIAKKLDLKPGLVGIIIRDKVNMGKRDWCGETYQVNLWSRKNNHLVEAEPLLTRQEFAEIQGKLRPRHVGALPEGFRWENGERQLTKEGEEKYNRIFYLRVEEKRSDKEISDDVGWSRTKIHRALKDPLLKEIVGDERWEKAQEIDLSGKIFDEYRKHGLEIRHKVMQNLPAYRWELTEKTGLSWQALNHHLYVLKRERPCRIKEKKGLFQKSWMPFPDWPLKTRFKRQSEVREEIVKVLEDRDLTVHQIVKATGLARSVVYRNLRQLAQSGVLEKIPLQKKKSGPPLPAKWRVRTK